MSNPLHIEYDLILARTKNGYSRVNRLIKRLAEEDGVEDAPLKRAREHLEQALREVKNSRKGKLG